MDKGMISWFWISRFTTFDGLLMLTDHPDGLGWLVTMTRRIEEEEIAEA